MTIRVRIEHLNPDSTQALTLRVGSLTQWRDITLQPGQSTEVVVHQHQSVVINEEKP